MKHGRVQARQRNDEKQKRNDNEPVQRKIAQVNPHPRPGVDGKEAGLRIEKVAVAPQKADRRRCRIEFRIELAGFRSRMRTEFADDAGESVGVTMDPRR